MIIIKNVFDYSESLTLAYKFVTLIVLLIYVQILFNELLMKYSLLHFHRFKYLLNFVVFSQLTLIHLPLSKWKTTIQTKNC